MEVLKYLLCPESTFQRPSSCHFLYQLSKSLCLMRACRALDIMVGNSTANILLRSWDNLSEIGLIFVLIYVV